ncbi:hypothetical protein U8V72_23080 [Priestia filamentosa]|uniref:hypothetical protein n=1 Tax=Priestia filamentosa TaxID=1402861 RepID=UPI000589374D
MSVLESQNKKLIDNVKQLQEQNNNTNLTLSTKIEKKKIQINGIEKSIGKTIFTLTVVNYEKLQNVSFFRMDYINEDKNKKPSKFILELYRELICYLIQYTKMKKHYLFIEIADETIQHHLDFIFSEIRFVNCTKYMFLFECEQQESSVVYGYLSDKEVSFLNNMQSLHKEWEKTRYIEPTLRLESYNYNEKRRVFKIERRNYYYANCIFKVTISKGILILQGDKIGKQSFRIKEGTLQEILSYIREEMGFYNLLNPPIKHFSLLLSRYLKIDIPKKDIKAKYTEIQQKTKKYNIEKESAYIVDVLDKERKKKEHAKLKKLREVQINMCCKLFKVHTPSCIWYIVTDLDSNTFKMLPSKEENKVPDEVLALFIKYLNNNNLNTV